MASPVSHLREGALSSRQRSMSVRVACLAAIILIELLAVAARLDGRVLIGSHGLRAVLHDWAEFSVRLTIASILAFLVLGEAQPVPAPSLPKKRSHPGSISWTLLLLHFAAMAIFVPLCSLVYRQHPAGAIGDLQVIAMVVTGLVAVMLAACALIPAAVWIEKIGSMRDLLIFAPVAGLAACVLGSLSLRMWAPLAHLTFATVSLILRPFLSGLIADAATGTIGSARFHVEIAPQCSGYEGIGLILAITGAWLWFLRRQWRFPNALLLIPIGAAAVWILNAVRIAGLVLIGNAGAEGIALGGFHSEAGWIVFSLVALGVCTAAREAAWFTKDGSVVSASVPDVPNPTAVYLGPFFAILGAALISRAASSDFEWLYGLRVLAAGATIWHFRRSYREFTWRVSSSAIWLGGLVFAIWIAIDYFTSVARSGAPEAFARAPLAAKSSWIALRLIGAVVIVPIAEELAFRGFLLRRLTASAFESVPWRNFEWAPFVLSSLAFGVLHGNRWIAGTLAGMIYAFAMFRRGRIADAIWAHAITNALLAAWVLITGNWQFW